MNSETLNVVPNFLWFNLPNVNQCDKKCIRKRLLRSSVIKGRRNWDLWKGAYQPTRKKYKTFLSSVDKFIQDRAAEKNVERSTISIIKTHQKKIGNLTKNITLAFTHNETTHNLSAIMLTTEELDVLKYDLKHPIHSLHVNKTDV